MAEFQGSGKQTNKVLAGYLSAGNLEICHIICVTYHLDEYLSRWARSSQDAKNRGKFGVKKGKSRYSSLFDDFICLNIIFFAKHFL